MSKLPTKNGGMKMNNKQKTVDEYIQILIDKNGYISKDISVDIIPEGHPAWKRYYGKISECEYEQTVEETAEIIEVYKNLYGLLKMLEYEGLKENYSARMLVRIVKYYEKEIENNNKSDYELANFYMELAFWGGRAYYPETGKPIYSTDDVLGFYDKALSLYEKSDEADESDIVYVYRQKGYSMQERPGDESHYKIAMEYYEKSLELYKKVLPQDDITIADIYLDMERLCGCISSCDSLMKEYCEKALSILPENHELRRKAYECYGYLVIGPEIKRISTDYYKQRLNFENSYDDLISIYEHLQSNASENGKYDEAVDYGNKLIELLKKVCGVIKPPVFGKLRSAYIAMANIYENGYKDYKKSEEYRRLAQSSAEFLLWSI